MKPDKLGGVLGHVKQEIIVRELGGTLVTPALPSPEQWAAELARYAPGCGSPVTLFCGEVRCGASVTWPDKRTTTHFCPHCESDLEPKRAPTRRELAAALLFARNQLKCWEMVHGRTGLLQDGGYIERKHLRTLVNEIRRLRYGKIA